MSNLSQELYQSLVQTGCFAYCAETDSCTVCTELICEQKGKKCPFFKTPANLQKAERESARTLLKRMEENYFLSAYLEKMGITKSELCEKAALEVE